MSKEFEAYSALMERCAKMEASKAALIRIAGADHLQWLQGQITNDIDRLDVGGHLDACFCTATGQLEASVRIWRFEDFVLVGASDLEIESILTRIERFVVMEDVEAQKLELIPIRIQGPESDRVAGSIESAFSLPSRHSEPGGFDLWFEESGFAKATARLEGLPEVTGELLDAVQIEAGIPRAGVDWNSKTLAAELGRRFNERTVSLEKGCYVGQEVLMRIASRGHTNREWVPVKLSQPVEPGVSVSAEVRADAGVITRSAISPRLGPVAAAMVRVEAAKPGTRLSIGGVEAIVGEFPI